MPSKIKYNPHNIGLMSLSQAHEYLGGNISQHQLEAFIKNGTIPSVLIGKVNGGRQPMYAITKVHLDMFIKAMFEKHLVVDGFESVPLSVLNKIAG